MAYKEQKKVSEMKKKKKDLLQRDTEDHKFTCAHCGKIFVESPFGLMSRFIMQYKPACSYKCNKALGQVETNSEKDE